MPDSSSKISAMRSGGKLLRAVKKQLKQSVVVGAHFEEIESLAQRLIREVGATPNFSTVPGYDWATCIMRNDELCHGIPKGKTVEDGDIITIDVGLLYQGFHLDTSLTFGVGEVSGQAQHFLSVGKQSLTKAINKAKVGTSVYDVSKAMQRVVESEGYGAVYQLTGHGIGTQLHMEPSIPCVAQRRDKKVAFVEGQTVAIEIMYTAGDPKVVVDDDGWTYRTADGSLSGMFEETVLVTKTGPEVLT